MEKRCSRCGRSKDLEAFARSRGGKHGRSAWCRLCWKTFHSEKRAALHAEIVKGAPRRFASFGRALSEARRAIGMTQEAVGKMVGVTGTQVRLWEKGYSLPRAKAMLAVCRRLRFEPPLSATRGDGGRIPLGVARCANPACGRRFPIYKVRVSTCSRSCGIAVRDTRGERNPAWKGGRTHGSGGYVFVKRPEHPRAYANGYVLEHVLVMEETLGRTLQPGERVHHRNGQRSDNRPENLELWKVKRKDPAGIRAADYHCAGCRCFGDC